MRRASRRRKVISGKRVSFPFADRFKQSQRTKAVGIGSVLGLLEGDSYVTLGGQIVNFVGLDLLNDPDQTGRIRQVAVVQNEGTVQLMWILVEMIDPRCVEQGGGPLDAVYNIPLTQQKIGQIRTILSCDSRYQSDPFGS